MSQPVRASVVVLAWNAWDKTRACLDALRPTLGAHDEVIVVDNGSQDATPAGLASYPWARVITNAENAGFAEGSNQGADAATGEFVVFLNNDTLPTPHWLDALLAPFADPEVGATGPRSNYVSGPQLVERCDYDPSRRRTLHAFARSWAQEHRGCTSPTNRLVGFCLAVRATAWRQVGGFDTTFEVGGYEDDDLCTRLAAAGHELRIVHDSFVHHDGHATFEANGLDWEAIERENERVFVEHRTRDRAEEGRTPLLAACLIVKDEEELLPGCLDSVAGLVDEVVVYDTGSTDDTVSIARAHGATVIEGYWDDDFGRARNAALDACTADWILHVDADERVEGDATKIRLALGGVLAADVLLVRIDNLSDDGSVGMSHRAARLFRRERAHWRGRLHEQVVARPGQDALRREGAVGLVIEHLGYRGEVMDAKGKRSRNVAIAEAELASGTGDTGVLLLNLARSLAVDGRPEEALARCEEVRALGTATPVIARLANLNFGAELLFTLGRPGDALAWISELRSAGEDDATCDFLEGTAHLLAGNADDAARLLADTRELTSRTGQTIATGLVRNRAALALAAAQRWDEAGPALLELLAEHGDQPVWGPLARALDAGAIGADAFVAAVPDDGLRPVLAQLLLAGTAAAWTAGEALWTRFPADARIIAYGVHLAPHLEVHRALEWAARVRSAGMEARCPLVAIAADGSQAVDRRLVAAAIAHGAFGDRRANQLVAGVAAVTAPDAFLESLVVLDDLAPELLPVFVEAALTDHARCEAMAATLDALGAVEQALDVKNFADSLSRSVAAPI